MSPLFLVVSAIETKFGVYSADQRLQQTLDTVASIRSRVRDAKICIIECGGQGIERRRREALASAADHVFDFTADSDVVMLYLVTDNCDVVKSGTEIMCFLKTLNMLTTSAVNHLNGRDRIFKISGRYLLNDGFNAGYYDREEVRNRIVIGTKKKSQAPEIAGQTWQYMSRLWSWPASLTPEILNVFTQSKRFFRERLNQKGFIDIEHLLARFLDPAHVLEVENLGIEGRVSRDGTAVTD